MRAVRAVRAVLVPGRTHDVDRPLLADTRRVLVGPGLGLGVGGVRWPGPPGLEDAWVAARCADVARSAADRGRRVASYDGAGRGLVADDRRRHVPRSGDFVASWLG